MLVMIPLVDDFLLILLIMSFCFVKCGCQCMYLFHRHYLCTWLSVLVEECHDVVTCSGSSSYMYDGDGSHCNHIAVSSVS